MSDQAPDALPEGWAETSLGSIVVKRKGARPARLLAAQEPDSIPYIDIRAFELSEFDNYVFPGEAVVVTKGSPLVVWDGSRCGLFGTAPCDGGLGSTLVELDMPAEILPYVGIFLRSSYSLLNSRSRGAGIPHIDSRVFDSLRLPLPPLAEQQRIVAKVDSAMQQARTNHAEVEDGFASVRQMREKALTDACSGKLTQDWRTKSHAPPWLETTLGELSSLITSGSRGWAKYYAEVGALFIRAQNINSDCLDLTEVAHVNPPEASEGARTRLLVSDLLVTITGANVTKAGLVETEIGEAYVSQHVALIRLQHPENSPFIFLWLKSPEHGRAKLLHDASFTEKPGLSLASLRELSVLLPGADEQVEIMRRVKDAMLQADAFESALLRTREQNEATAQTTLDRAFRGELVPTEASLARAENRSYEDGAALLERIRSEMSHRKAQPRPKRPKNSNRMKPLTPEQLKDSIRKLPADNFSFADLKSTAPGSYDDLQRVLFLLLDEPKPLVRQVFDKTAKKMQFQRLAP